MKSLFETYLTLGFEHIADPQAYDHIVFIIALCAIYRIAEWKKVAILVTAFTVGHSLTLALAALDLIKINRDLIEFLIPLTILITSLYNVAKPLEKEQEGVSLFSKSINVNYFFALFFGLIHGMGFSNFFKSLLGQESSIVAPLFAFNVGIELGQLIIVAFLLLASYLALSVFKLSQKSWNQFISGAAAGIAITLMIPFLMDFLS